MITELDHKLRYKIMSEVKIKLVDNNIAVEFILQRLYFSEFQIIDGLNQHPNGINFYKWLLNNDLILKEEYDRITDKIQSEYDE